MGQNLALSSTSRSKLLSPFRLDQISMREASALTAADRYGVTWFRQLLAEWETARRGWGHDGQRNRSPRLVGESTPYSHGN